MPLFLLRPGVAAAAALAAFGVFASSTQAKTTVRCLNVSFQPTSAGKVQLKTTPGERNDLTALAHRDGGYSVRDSATPVVPGKRGARGQHCTSTNSHAVRTPPSRRISGFSADLGAGDDTLRLDATALSVNFIFGAITGGDGDDTIDFSARRVGSFDFRITGGSGNDQITVDWQQPRTTIAPGVHANHDGTGPTLPFPRASAASVTGGAGDDVIHVVGASSKILRINCGLGHDVLYIDSQATASSDCEDVRRVAP